MAKYDFRRELIDPHANFIADGAPAKEDELALPKTLTINACGAGKVTLTAVDDFIAFAARFFGITAKSVDSDDAFITLKTKGSSSYPIKFDMDVTAKGITLCGVNDRSVAQAVYYLEFLIKERRFAAVKKCRQTRKMPYSPRMVHSAYGLDEYPDGYLSALAHYGYDAILIFVKGVNQTTQGYLDFNELCGRAEKYGIDVYVYCYISNFTSPKTQDAVKIYDELYGSLFKACPKLKGMVFVGESVEFLSDDEHVVKHKYNEYPKEGIPENKPSPGWWPCYDYVDWISLVRDSIRRYKKDADVVFWTYNWGWAPEKDRLSLIEKLPTDISLLVTFEMFEKYKVGGIYEKVSDYSIARPQAGSYFISEARAAKKRGIRLYSMVNTAGRTWDFGTAPYLPFPNAWIKRHKDINFAHDEYGLCGLMEGHHYGAYPNFIARLAYLSYYSRGYEENLERALKAEYGFCDEHLKRGLKLWSDAIKYLPTTIEEQYGPLRVGTVYPLCLIKPVQPPEEEGALMGNTIWSPMYGQFENGLCLGFGDNGTPYALRERGELRMLAKMSKLIKEGIDELERCEKSTVERLINLGKYINCCVKTVYNVKVFHRYKTLLKLGAPVKNLREYANGIREVAKREIENARESIEYLEKDSSLGFEPAMKYAASKERVLWKIEQVEYMLENELPFYEV